MYLLRGAKVPFALRTAVNVALGKTYVHGFMDGEVVSGISENLSDNMLF